MRPSRSPFTVLTVAVAFSGLARAQLTTRVSVATGGTQGDNISQYPSISADCRYVAFWGSATNLVPGDTNGFLDVFVRDRQNGTTERVSIATGGAQGDAHSRYASISGDGRYVAFESSSANLVGGDTNGYFDIFVHDRQSGITERVSVSTGGAQASGGDSELPSISADGRYVAFESAATNLVAGDTNGASDIFVRDRQLGTTERVSVDSLGVQGDNFSHHASISGDGLFVAFDSFATNLVGMDTNGFPDVFVRDRLNASTTRVSISTAGVQANGQNLIPSISGDGRYVAFRGTGGNLVSGDTNGSSDVFVRDRQNASTVRVSITTAGVQGNQSSGVAGVAISPDGRCVAFQSNASNLVTGDTNGFSDVFVHDSQSGVTERVSIDSGGGQGDNGSSDPAISALGRCVVFNSVATNLVVGDTNAAADVFLRDRDVTGFTSLCHPGTGGVIPCPCANPPSATGRGCDNSSATGGATLTASGLPSLSSDSLVFTTSGEKPTATSILLQGTSASASGAVFGQGVRCAAGTLKRLYVHNAVGGSMSAPVGADLPVSARSAQLGDPITAGTPRFYGVYYRDATVLGGCPAASTFNMTQSGSVQWQP